MKYIKEQKKSKVFAMVMLVALVWLIVLILLDCCGVFDPPAWKPVAEYPFVNQHIQLRGWMG